MYIVENLPHPSLSLSLFESTWIYQSALLLHQPVTFMFVIFVLDKHFCIKCFLPLFTNNLPSLLVVNLNLFHTFTHSIHIHILGYNILVWQSVCLSVWQTYYYIYICTKYTLYVYIGCETFTLAFNYTFYFFTVFISCQWPYKQ